MAASTGNGHDGDSGRGELDRGVAGASVSAEGFTNWGQFGPGALDLRVFDQGEYWVDRSGQPHRILEMADAEARNILEFLRRHANHFYVECLRREVVASVFESFRRPGQHLDPGPGQDPERGPSRRRDQPTMVDLTPTEWLESTGLAAALREQMRRTRAAGSVAVNRGEEHAVAPEFQSRVVRLLDHDVGTWAVATHGAFYVFDLDERAVLPIATRSRRAVQPVAGFDSRFGGERGSEFGGALRQEVNARDLGRWHRLVKIRTCITGEPVALVVRGADALPRPWQSSSPVLDVTRPEPRPTPTSGTREVPL